MSTLNAFLKPAVSLEEKEVIISNRFQDEKGNVVPFKIRAVTQEENDAITKRATKVRKVDGTPMDYLDSVDFTRRMVIAATVEPDFRSQDMCMAYGVADPLMVPGKMLSSGEYKRLVKEIMTLSGFEESPEEEAKN